LGREPQLFGCHECVAILHESESRAFEGEGKVQSQFVERKFRPAFTSIEPVDNSHACHILRPCRVKHGYNAAYKQNQGKGRICSRPDYG